MTETTENGMQVYVTKKYFSFIYGKIGIICAQPNTLSNPTFGVNIGGRIWYLYEDEFSTIDH